VAAHAVATVMTLILAVHRKMSVVVNTLVLVDMALWFVDEFEPWVFLSPAMSNLVDDEGRKAKEKKRKRREDIGKPFIHYGFQTTSCFKKNN
jgi:hypothetical protein